MERRPFGASILPMMRFHIYEQARHYSIFGMDNDIFGTDTQIVQNLL